MRNPIQIFKRSLLVTAVSMFAAGCSDSEFSTQSAEAADNQNPAGVSDSTTESGDQEFHATEGRSSSDGDMAAENWDNPAGQDPDAVAPSNVVGMAAEEWRSLEQPVVRQSEFAAENWKNPGDAAPVSSQSSEYDMATKNWGVER